MRQNKTGSVNCASGGWEVQDQTSKMLFAFLSRTFSDLQMAASLYGLTLWRKGKDRCSLFVHYDGHIWNYLPTEGFISKSHP